MSEEGYIPVDLSEEFRTIREQSLVAHDFLSRMDRATPVRDYLDSVEIRMISMQKILAVVAHHTFADQEHADDS